MSKKKTAAQAARKTAESESGRKNRNFPKHTLEDALPLAQKIQDEMGGAPMNRLLLADALGLSPSSSNFRDLLSSAYKYGLTDGTEKADTISLTATGAAATQHADPASRLRALRQAALTPIVFGRLLRDYSNKKVPSAEMLPKILRAQYAVPDELTSECAAHIAANGRFVDIIRDIGGSAHVLLDADLSAKPIVNGEQESAEPAKEVPAPQPTDVSASVPATPATLKPLQQLQSLLTAFQIPHRVVVEEANLGRPISQKVKDTINDCGSAILIFTRDEKFFDESGKEVWRPSENVVHELGATAFAYGDRIVIFKEKGLHFPTNFQSIGYIEFESGDLTARTADLLKELIGFGLVRVTPTQ
jgi:hypothetical protein